MGEAMKGLKSFLGLDPTQPSGKLPLTNWKHKRGDENSVGGGVGGWAWVDGLWAFG